MTCFFLSASSLKRLKAVLSDLAVDLVAELLQRRAQRVAAGVLAQHELVGVQPDRRGVHDLVGRALLEDAVLVDARLVGEGVAPDDRLVGLHRVAGQAADEAARAGDLARVDAGAQADVGLARVQEHHDLLERRVARALADAVDRALDLARAGQHAGERVGHRQPEVVVAVHREHDVAQARHALVEAGQEGRVLLRHRVADGVGDVDRRRALVERDLDDLGREVEVGARGVHRRELDVVAELARLRHRGPGQALDVLARALQLVDDVDVRGRDEGVDARALGVAHRLPRALDVGGIGARQAGDHGSMDLAGDRLHGLEVAGRGDREARLDDVDAQARELVGDLELLGRVERDARRLLAVAQRGVEDQYSVRAFGWHVVLSIGFVLRLLS